MSMAGLIDPEMNHKKTLHRRNDSGELDVFEAARYFSGYNEAVGYTGSTLTQKIMREERHGHRARISLDMPMRSLLPQQFHGMEKQMKEKKHKQPSSPGGRLASFLNSLFSQSASKKKKSKSSTQSMKDEDESPGGRRRRRSSISHFRSSSTADSRSIYSSLSSGFRTPPYVQTPTKSCKEFRTLSDHKHAVSLSTKYNESVKPTTLQNEWLDDKKKRDPTLLDDNNKHSNGLSEKQKKCSNEFPEKNRIWLDKYSEEEKEIRKFNEVDDGAESDSSSDLFELQNYDLGYYPSGLPVYETTNMDNIKRGAPISNGPL
ncbi:protein BIG GRAIN 1-like E [Gastrolobium bilobum]|uniref:protein BIG GRAIN 1-like E n=1 Tax=Gastrolobium bilobum TaxID=150636 RepID=UPI002AB1E208|nr:protein BIG GRAIN 1-like E [Gastrolobium bilobum]